MGVAILFLMIVGLLVAGVPIAISLGLSSILFLLVLSDTSLASVAQSLYQAMAGHYTLLAIPFFILASSFMSTGGVAQRIIRFAVSVVGHFRGGLAIAGVFAVLLTAAVLRASRDHRESRRARPATRSRGYDRAACRSLTSCAGSARATATASSPCLRSRSCCATKRRACSSCAAR